MPITQLDLAYLLASTDHADFPARRRLEEVSVAIAKAKKVIVVSGAGISCSSGIPDFRSADGLYSLVKKRYPDAFVTGRDLFSAGLFMNPSTTSIFLTFIAELSLACQRATPTRTHHFVHKLDRTGKLLRSYTQNVDGFERRMGMESGGRGRGLHKKTTRNVELHGDLGRVRCTLCFSDYEARLDWVEMMREGEAPDCPKCLERHESRIKRAARGTSIGILRPSIVLYDEPHPLGDDIGMLQSHDMSRTPDVMIIMGTSLKVTGLKALVKDFAKAIHAAKRPGLVVFVNATKPGKEWEDVIDVHVQGDTDTWVERVEEVWRRVKPGDWEVQTKLDMGVVVPVSAGKGKSTGESQPTALPPTPRQTASPSSSASRTSSPLTSPASPPVSPSKRRNMPTPDPTPGPSPKKARPAAPSTGVTSTPGRGNLFAPSSRPFSHSTSAARSFSRTTSTSSSVFGADAENFPASQLFFALGSQDSAGMASQTMALDEHDEEGEEEGAADKEVESDVDELDPNEDEDEDQDEDQVEKDLVERPAMLDSGYDTKPASVASVISHSQRSTRSSSARLSKLAPASRATGKTRSAPVSTAVGRLRSARPASALPTSQRDKENAPPSQISTAIRSAARKAKMPGSPLKTAPTALRATRLRAASARPSAVGMSKADGAEKVVMGLRRSNRA